MVSIKLLCTRVYTSKQQKSQWGVTKPRYRPFPPLSHFDIVGTNGHLTAVAWRLWTKHIHAHWPAGLLVPLLEYKHMNDFLRWAHHIPGLVPAESEGYEEDEKEQDEKVHEKEEHEKEKATNVSVVSLDRGIFTDAIPMPGGWGSYSKGPPFEPLRFFPPGEDRGVTHRQCTVLSEYVPSPCPSRPSASC